MIIEFIEFIQFRLKSVIPDAIPTLDLDHVIPGYIIYKRMADDTFKLYVECGLCLHVATEPLKCDRCNTNYCRSCAIILINAKSKGAVKNEEEDILTKSFVCMYRCKNLKIVLGYNEKVNSIGMKILKMSGSEL